MNYITAIKTACLYFPFIALIFTIPFILYQYHKYGSINKLRVLIVYSFILYLMCVYFLVILPLPNMKTMTPPTKSMIKIIPFSFIVDIINETSFRINDPSTYLKALIDPCIYTVLFNIVMTIPFGIYLRYYYKCSKKKTILLTFLLSLFFELTQVSRLYFIYPYQYRVFDVDDLMTNTLGGLIGYYIFGFVSNLLPTRDEIDKESYIAGQNVSGLRRITLFCLDLFIWILLSANIMAITGCDYIPLIIFVIYYLIIPLINKKQTLGCKFLNIKLQNDKYQILFNFIRMIYLYLYYLVIPIALLKTANKVVIKLNMETHGSIMLYFLVFCIISLYLIINIIILIRNNKIYYDKIFKTKYISTITNKESE